MKLLKACKEENIEEVERLLAEGEDVNFKNKTGLTALMIASNKGLVEIATSLINAGANVDDANKGGATPLMLASTKGHTEIVALLIAAEANIDIKNENGATALSTARKKGYIEIIELIEKVDSKSLDDTKEALKEAGEKGYEVLKEASKIGYSALKTASEKGYSAVKNSSEKYAKKLKERESVASNPTSSNDQPSFSDIKVLINDNEEILYEGRPSKTAFASAIVSIMLIPTLILVVTILIYIFDNSYRADPEALIGTFFIIFLPAIIASIVKYYGWKAIQYIITDRRTFVKQGIFNRKIMIVPNNKIQVISINTGSIDRRLGLNTISIDTSASGGGIFSALPLVGSTGICFKHIKDALTVINSYDRLGL